VKFIVIPANLCEPLRIEEVDDKQGYDKAREWVRGYIQIVRVRGFKRLEMCVDEDGHSKQLPPNIRATTVADAYNQKIVGDVVVTGSNFKSVDKYHPEIIEIIRAWAPTVA